MKLKFRAWDESINRMRYFEPFVYTQENMVEVEYVARNKLPVQQFTGLHDATNWNDLTPQEQKAWIDSGGNKGDWPGKEIYKGDVVEIFDVDNVWIGRVDFVDGCFNVLFELEGGDTELLRDIKPFGVIGNIYEHGHLLEDNNDR